MIEFPNIRHLIVFREVADAKGVSAAAERVHLSQPAVTQAVAGLEQRFDTRLFERQSGGMFLTEAGAILNARIARLFNLLSSGAREAARLAGRSGRRPDPAFHTRATAAQFRALVAVGETGNFSYAARATGLAQPSIHRAARELEKLAGMEFFHPGRRGIELTPAAERFLRAVKLAGAELRQGLDELGQLAGRDSTRIVVGSMPLSRTAILPQAINGLLAESGGVQVRTVDGPYAELLRGLRHGDIDLLIGALRDPPPVEDIEQEALLTDMLSVVARPGHPLAGRPGLRLEDTLDYPWIAPPADTPSGSYLFRKFDIGARDRTPVRVVSSSLVLVRGLVARGDYLALMSLNQAAVEYRQGLMAPLDIELADSRRAIGLTTRAGWLPTPTQARFLDLVRGAANAPYSENQ